MKKNILGSVIRDARKSKNLTQKQLSELTGYSQNTISNHENGNRSLDEDNIKTYAKALGLTSDDLFEALDIKNSIENKIMYVDRKQTKIDDFLDVFKQLIPPRQVKVYNFAKHQLEEQKEKKVHLYGATAANPQELSYGDTIYDETIETNVPKNADCALVVQGDSMEPEYKNGEIVFYKSQPVVENGEMAIVEINGDGVTLKKVYFNYDEDKVILRSLNNKYADRELNPNQVRILGKVVK
ncbi:helix-turn-helix domain-containing protein [Enterococcus italicus]